MRRASISFQITPSLMSLDVEIDDQNTHLIHFDAVRGNMDVEFWSLDLRKLWLEQDDLKEPSPHLTSFEYQQIEGRMRTQFEESRRVYLQFSKQKLRLVS